MGNEFELFLSDVVPFSFLPPQALKEAADGMSIFECRKGTLLFSQGQSRLEYVYVVEQGAAERYYQEGDAKIIHTIMGEGDIYGGISLLVNNGIAIRNLKTIEDTRFLVLPKIKFLEMCDRHGAFRDFFTDLFGKRMLDRTYAQMFSSKRPPVDEAQQVFSLSMNQVCNRNLVVCDVNTSIRQAAVAMDRSGCSSILVRDAGGRLIGIVTDRDLRSRVVAAGADASRPVVDVMSLPLCSVPSSAYAFEGFMAMVQHHVKHIAVVDDNENVIGMVTAKDLLSTASRSPIQLVRQIQAAQDIRQLTSIRGQLPAMVSHLIENGAKAQNLTRMITGLSDNLLQRVISFAIEEFGPAPVPFAFMVMGSEGREEQTLKTDQDNAIIFQDVPDSDHPDVLAYFLKLGDRICSLLDQAGYSFCPGGVMAKNAECCRSLSQWKNHFFDWIHSGRPQDLLNASIFFDFRRAYGSSELVDGLRAYLFDWLDRAPAFFRFLAINALKVRPPIGFFRNFVLESKGGRSKVLDLKSAMTIIVDFVRIFALANRVFETNTLKRLHQLRLREVFTAKDINEIEEPYCFLMQLRFIRQVAMIVRDKTPPDNYINPRELSGIEQAVLKEVFKRSEKLQERLKIRFVGLG